jgi:hypothetical protein
MSDSVLLAAIRLVDRGALTLTDEDDPEIVFQTLAFDISVSDGRIYSGVAPGAAFLAAPFYALLRPLVPWFDDDVIKSRRITSYYFTNSRSLGKPKSDHFKGMYLLQILLVLSWVAPWYAWFLVKLHDAARERGAPPAQAILLAVAVGVGGLTLYYSTMYSRQAVAYLLLWSGILPFLARREPTARMGFVAGALGGAAISVDYLAAPAVGLFVLFSLPRHSPRGRLALVLPLLSLLAQIGMYHRAAFGSFLTTPYHHRFWQTPPILAERGVDFGAFQEGAWLGANRPSPGVMLQLCFGRFKGLFLYSPILVMGLVGHVRSLRRSNGRGVARFCLVVFLAYLALNSSLGTHVEGYAHHFWGGLSVLWGPRYLFAVQPFLAWGLLSFDWGRVSVRVVSMMLLVISCFLNVLGAMYSQVMMSTFAFGPELEDPLAYVIDLLVRLGPRVSLLDAYGVGARMQLGVFVSLLAVSAALLVCALRASDSALVQGDPNDGRSFRSLR